MVGRKTADMLRYVNFCSVMVEKWRRPVSSSGRVTSIYSRRRKVGVRSMREQDFTEGATTVCRASSAETSSQAIRTVVMDSQTQPVQQHRRLTDLR